MQLEKTAPQKAARLKRYVRIAAILILTLLVAFCVFFVVLLRSTEVAIESASHLSAYPTIRPLSEPFPVSVDPARKLISTVPIVHTAVEVVPEDAPRKLSLVRWLKYHIEKLARLDWFQSLASLTGRTLVIEPGERKEQVAINFGKVLGWNKEERARFMELVSTSSPALIEGKFYPDTYISHADATPEEVAEMVHARFVDKVLSRYTPDVEALVPLRDTLTIASLLEREAYDFEDMRHISGVIWNRLFIGMKLQIDATLQYARGSRVWESWWPTPRPSDKYIDSPFNTYQHDGLPPAPIANPSTAAIIAALNPVVTNCLFYFHDKTGSFHCTETYEEHVALLKEYYGRGR